MKSTLYPTIPATVQAPKPFEVVEVAGVTHVINATGTPISIE